MKPFCEDCRPSPDLTAFCRRGTLVAASLRRGGRRTFKLRSADQRSMASNSEQLGTAPSCTAAPSRRSPSQPHGRTADHHTHRLRWQAHCFGRQRRDRLGCCGWWYLGLRSLSTPFDLVRIQQVSLHSRRGGLAGAQVAAGDERHLCGFVLVT